MHAEDQVPWQENHGRDDTMERLPRQRSALQCALVRGCDEQGCASRGNDRLWQNDNGCGVREEGSEARVDTEPRRKRTTLDNIPW